MLNPGLPEEPYFHLLIPMQPTAPAVLACPGCGLNYQAFQHSSHMGCARCYSHFRQTVDVWVRRIHGSAQHHGKVPSAVQRTLRQELGRLQELLSAAIAAERFEEAAVLRDRINALRQDLGDATA